MIDALNVIVDGDLLRTFGNIFTVIIALDLFTLVCMIFAKAKNDV